jgi:hypothetical protein
MLRLRSFRNETALSIPRRLSLVPLSALSLLTACFFSPDYGRVIQIKHDMKNRDWKQHFCMRRAILSGALAAEGKHGLPCFL